MTLQEAQDKIRKLLRLSESANVHEAALAAARAQEIMTRYQISSVPVETEASASNEPIRDFCDDPLESNNSRVTWKSRLACAIARENACKGYTCGGDINIVGRPSDVSTVRYLYGFLVREVDRITRRECVGNGRTYANNFRIGCVETVSSKLQEQRGQTVAAVKAEAVSPHALMIVENALAAREQYAKDVSTWVSQNLRLRSVSSNARQDYSARDHGRHAANEINIGRASAAIGGANARLTA
jgi:hypothetical protein